MPELNLGQTGSARRAANTAYYSLHVAENPERTRSVPQNVPQQNVAFVDVMGFEQGDVEWRGTVKVSAMSVWRAMVSELNQYQHGSARVGGRLAAPSLVYIRPTRLTDSFGNVMCETARLLTWNTDGRIVKLTGSDPFLFATRLTVRFVLLG